MKEIRYILVFVIGSCLFFIVWVATVTYFEVAVYNPQEAEIWLERISLIATIGTALLVVFLGYHIFRSLTR